MYELKIYVFTIYFCNVKINIHNIASFSRLSTICNSEQQHQILKELTLG